jgi:hypothetical protein
VTDRWHGMLCSLLTHLRLDGAVHVIAAQVVDQQLHDLIAVGQDVLLHIAAQVTQHAHN